MEPGVFASITKILVDLSVQLFKGRYVRLEAAYEGCLEPINEKFTEVHDAYRKLFLQLNSRLPTLNGETWEIPNSDQIFGSDFRDEAVRTSTMEAISWFKAEREEFEHSRDVFRNASQEAISACEDEDYRRYFCSFVYYFLDVRGGHYDDQFYDQKAASILRKGGDALDTPSERLSLNMSSAQSPLEIRHLVSHSLSILETRYTDTQAYFWRIKAKIARNA